MARDIFGEVRTPRVRIRLPAGGDSGQALTLTVDGQDDNLSTNNFPAKEWSIEDNMMNLSDSASVSIANEDGEHSGKFTPGQAIIIDESDPDVAGGQWTRHFTGRVTSVDSYTDVGGGSNIMLTAMDLGWHLTSSHGKPLDNIKGIKFQKLLDILIDPSWGFGKTQSSNDLNKRLKHGRQVIIQEHKPVLGGILPFIQIEPGQAPFDILRTYVQREGLLINVSARGQLLFFRPHYEEQALYRAEFHSSVDAAANSNNLIGRPSLRRAIDGLYSEVQCWSTVVIPPEVSNSENPNEMYRHSVYTPSPNPLPFQRLHVFSDGEAINNQLRKNRAIWKAQLDAFNSWEYNCEFQTHSQGGAFFVSDTMISVDDTVNGARRAGDRDPIPKGNYYVQSVRRSLTLRDGLRSRLVIRKPGLLNPELASLVLGGGAKKSAKPQKSVK